MKLVKNTRRLKIRPLDFSDYRAWKAAQLAMAPPKNTWDQGAAPKKNLTKTAFNKMIRSQRARRKSDTFYNFAVFEKKSGALVGIVSLMEVARAISQTSYLGYRIFNNHWGHGYAKEAVRAVLDIGFRQVKLHRIEAGIEPGNVRSMRLARSLGMRREGLKKRAIYLRKQWVDLLMYTLTSEDVGLRFNPKNLTLFR